ncbi:hypothetical protein AN958_02229 [Leucoagaricus sp. SymC.cos]|nr:hypothetical protein AN958_02229 [Leucoagaricus sp. SymC.cos]
MLPHAKFTTKVVENKNGFLCGRCGISVPPGIVPGIIASNVPTEEARVTCPSCTKHYIAKGIAMKELTIDVEQVFQTASQANHYTQMQQNFTPSRSTRETEHSFRAPAPQQIQNNGMMKTVYSSSGQSIPYNASAIQNSVNASQCTGVDYAGPSGRITPIGSVQVSSTSCPNVHDPRHFREFDRRFIPEAMSGYTKEHLALELQHQVHSLVLTHLELLISGLQLDVSQMPVYKSLTSIPVLENPNDTSASYFRNRFFVATSKGLDVFKPKKTEFYVEISNDEWTILLKYNNLIRSMSPEDAELETMLSLTRQTIRTPITIRLRNINILCFQAALEASSEAGDTETSSPAKSPRKKSSKRGHKVQQDSSLGSPQAPAPKCSCPASTQAARPPKPSIPISTLPPESVYSDPSIPANTWPTVSAYSGEEPVLYTQQRTVSSMEDSEKETQSPPSFGSSGEINAPTQPPQASVTASVGDTTVERDIETSDEGGEEFEGWTEDDVQVAMLSGGRLGNLNLDVIIGGHITDNVAIYPIKRLPFASIIQISLAGELPFSLKPGDAQFGLLEYDRTDAVGQGAFKVTFACWFSLQTLLPVSQDKSARMLALKRVFKPARKKPAIVTLPGSTHTPTTPSPPAPIPLKDLKFWPKRDELMRICAEATTLGWATSLVLMAYDFIENVIKQKGVQPPWPIPQLWMVKGYVCAYLLEEFIQGDELLFLKYILNSQAVLLLPPTHKQYKIAEFLCFMQHVQWVKTNGIAFMSDFQGGKTLLTDPQIMTHLEKLSGTFCEGNLKVAFHQFPCQHECNKYCEWFGLERLIVSGIDKGAGVAG